MQPSDLDGQIDRGRWPVLAVQRDVDEGDDGVEVSAGDGREDEDQDGQPERGGDGVLEQLQADVGGGQALRGDAGADDDRGESRAAEELADGSAQGRAHEATRSCEIRSSAPGTSVK